MREMVSPTYHSEPREQLISEIIAVAAKWLARTDGMAAKADFRRAMHDINQQEVTRTNATRTRACGAEREWRRCARAPSA